MKKIVLVSNASWTMIKFRYGLMSSLVKNNYEVYVISPKDEYSMEIESLGCKYIDIYMDNKGSNPFKDIKLVYDLYKIYKNINPDLIIHYTIKPNIYGSFAAKLLSLKSISVIPGLGYTFINDNITAKIAKLLYKLALSIPCQVWFINSDDKNLFIQKKLVKEDKIRSINGEGVNIDTFKPVDIDKKHHEITFLMIARILKDKGIYEYIEAARRIKAKYTHVKFELLGSIYTLNPSSVQKKEINKWIKEGVIDYLGEKVDVREYIAKSDCIVLPSYREGLSMSLMESASMARPIITTNVPGCKEIVVDSLNGYLCQARNAKDLADKMEKMINLSQDERDAMGRAGRDKIVIEFDEKIIINKYLDSIKEILL